MSRHLDGLKCDRPYSINLIDSDKWTTDKIITLLSTDRNFVLNVLMLKDAAVDAARAAGRVLMTLFQKAEVREKGTKDLVTEADLAAQKVIQDRLMNLDQDLGWVAEEDVERTNPRPGQACWVVDPLDGTANYVHGLPNFAVSIALVRDRQCLLGVVYDPVVSEMFWAVQGGGAFLNGRKIHASQCVDLDRSMLAASFPPNVQRDSVEVRQFVEALVECQSIRRLGSAALNLCYVGCGRLDGYWASCVRSWDVAAGVLVAQESGAVITNWKGGEFNVWKGDLSVAASAELHQQMMVCLARSYQS